MNKQPKNIKYRIVPKLRPPLGVVFKLLDTIEAVLDSKSKAPRGGLIFGIPRYMVRFILKQ
jgi:hypothetical protein